MAGSWFQLPGFPLTGFLRTVGAADCGNADCGNAGGAVSTLSRRLYSCTTSLTVPISATLPPSPPTAMTTVPLAQARQQLSGLLDRIQAGECVVISRYGKPVARLIPELSGQVGAELWLERLRRLHQEAGHGAV